MVKDSGYLYLVSQAKAGDRDSMEQLAFQVQRKIHPYICGYISDRNISDDLLQEVLLAIVRRIERLEKTESFWPWVYTIAWTKVQQHFRDENRRKDFRVWLADKCPELNSLWDERSTLDDVIDKEELQAVNRLVGQLEEEFQEPIRFRFFEGMTYARAASKSRCSISASRLRFIRAKEYLRSKLSVLAEADC